MNRPIDGLTEQQTEDYLAELTALAHKYGKCIRGCGCCGSPYFEEAKKGKYIISPDYFGPELDWEEPAK